MWKRLNIINLFIFANIRLEQDSNYLLMLNWKPKLTYFRFLVKDREHICGISATRLLLCNILDINECKESGSEVVREDLRIIGFFLVPQSCSVKKYDIQNVFLQSGIGALRLMQGRKNGKLSIAHAQIITQCRTVM